MPSRVIFLQPKPRPLCGVTDHSRFLMAELGRLGIASDIATLDELAAMTAAELADSRLFVQASIYGFQAKGVPIRLVLELQRARAAGARISTFFHELWVPDVKLGSSAFWLNPAQRLVCRRLAACSSTAHFNTPWGWTWGRHLMGERARYSPTFSTIGEVLTCLPLSERPPVLVCFGAAKSRATAYLALQPQLRALQQAGHIEEIVDIGADATIAPTAAIEAAGLRVRVLGASASEVVSAELARARYGMHYTPWSLATKSSIYGALVAHGVLPISIHEVDPLPLGPAQALRDAAIVLMGVQAWAQILTNEAQLFHFEHCVKAARLAYKPMSDVAREISTDFLFAAPMSSQLIGAR